MRKPNTKKILAAVSASILITALLMGGAYAVSAFSPIVSTGTETETSRALLHEDYRTGGSQAVYVENTGENDIFIRVQFKEFLQIGNNILVGEDSKEPSTWSVHTFAGADIADCGCPCCFCGHLIIFCCSAHHSR